MKECTLENDKIYKIAFIWVIPFILLLSFSYIFFNGGKFHEINNYYDSIEKLNFISKIYKGFILPFIIFNIGILLHEVIHALLFTLFNDLGISSVKIGFKKKELLPYTYCSGKIKLNNYRITLIAPAIILGLIPLIIAIFLSNSIIWFYSFLFLIAGTGDIVLFIHSLKTSGNQIIVDHPTKLGFKNYE